MTAKRQSDPVPPRMFEVTLVGGPGKRDVVLPRLRPEIELEQLKRSAESAGYGFRAVQVEKL